MKKSLILLLGIIILNVCSEKKENLPSKQTNIEPVSTKHHTNYWDNGSIKSEGDYINGKQEGLWKTYRENGELRATAFFKADNLNGKYTEWNNRGNLSKTGYYENDIKTGLWAIYNSDGDTMQVRRYANGKLISTEDIIPKTALSNYEKTYDYIYKNCIKKVTSVMQDELPWIFFNLFINENSNTILSSNTDSINIIYTKDKDVIEKLNTTTIFRNNYVNMTSDPEIVFGLKGKHVTSRYSISTPDKKNRLIIFPSFLGFERMDNILTLWENKNDTLFLKRIFQKTIPVSIGGVSFNNLYKTPKGYLLDLETHGGDGGDAWGSNDFYMLSYDGELNELYSLGHSCNEQRRQEKVDYSIDTSTYCIKITRFFKEPTPDSLLKSNEIYGFVYPEEWSVELKDTICTQNVKF